MTTAACLFFTGMTGAVVAPRLLHRRSAFDAAPLLGVTVWVAAVASVLLTWLAAAGLLIVEIAMTTAHGRMLIEACMAVLRTAAHPDTAGRALAAVVTSAGAGVLLWAVGRLGQAVREIQQNRRRHLQSVRIVGHAAADLAPGTIVLDVPERAAYSLPGRDPAIVITTGAIEGLDEQELAAVLAHERAHLDGRHHLVLTSLRALRRAFGSVRLFGSAEAEVARLLELCADDQAARRHGRAPLLAALVVMANGTVPEPALGMSGSSVLDRAIRLVTPPSAKQRRTARLSLAGMLTGAVLAPIALLAPMVLLTCTAMLG